MADVISIFDEWCGKNNLNPIASTRCIGFNRRKRFLCELSVSEYPYRALGNSKVREDAERNAFRDFMNYLVRSDKFPADAVPIASEHIDDSALSEQKHLHASDKGEGLLKTRDECESLISKESKRAYKETEKDEVVAATTSDNWTVENAMPIASEDNDDSARSEQKHLHASDNGEGLLETRDECGSLISKESKRAYKETEKDEVVAATTSDNWTVENAISKLHQFMQVNRITADYKYTVVGPEHARMFELEMRIAFGNPKSIIAAKEAASKKKLANKLCCFSLLKQLYSKGVMNEFASSARQEKDPQQGLQPSAKKYKAVFPKNHSKRVGHRQMEKEQQN
uniref:DRBM domain-containing protein n=1 Tax=Glossina austeni TaxID=7395 RepID=A0A1A9UTB4_GLOAU